MKALAVIPARYASTRFPGKPLVLLAGKPMVQRVCERAARARNVQEVIVATDDQRIASVVESFGGKCIMTRADHGCGTDRIAEVADARPAEIYVNVQGDEPLIEPAAIDQVASLLANDSNVAVATLCVPISSRSDVADSNIVKVVFDGKGSALYFSRAAIPCWRDEQSTRSVAGYKHLGLYAYTREALRAFARLPRGRLEQAEQLEQLRFLENGFRIRVGVTDHDSVSVDVPEDVPRVESLLRVAGE
jgi:3-deoxy-manno-octulosonate cytidylyltransferase (CMP-KDO synthetase)